MKIKTSGPYEVIRVTPVVDGVESPMDVHFYGGVCEVSADIGAILLEVDGFDLIPEPVKPAEGFTITYPCGCTAGPSDVPLPNELPGSHPEHLLDEATVRKATAAEKRAAAKLAAKNKGEDSGSKGGDGPAAPGQTPAPAPVVPAEPVIVVPEPPAAPEAPFVLLLAPEAEVVIAPVTTLTAPPAEETK